MGEPATSASNCTGIVRWPSPRAGKHRESADDWTHVIALSTEPVPSGYHVKLAIELAHVGEVDRAQAQVQSLNPAQAISGEDRYNLGYLFSLWAAAAQKDTRISPDQRARLVESDIANALRWLKSAANAGFFKDPAVRDHARKDPDLEILRDLPEFHRLIESNGAKP